VQVEQGKVYKWCACGLSDNQPFCDGSHSATNILPITFTAEESKLVSFCGCKHSKNSPLCDGTHKSIE
jgi:CDGSH-type Zn-finger protein